MKILHTSDWHLGHTLYNFDRTEEQLSMLNQIIEIVREQKPDVFLLCGDVYHTSQPSSAVQTMFTEAMVRLHDANPEMTIVVTAGNHDSGTKHEIFRTPWKALKVHVIGSLNKDAIDEHIVEIQGKGYVIAVPYAYERNIPDGLFQQLLDVVADRNVNGLPVAMSAHATVNGCDYTGHDHANERTVGGIDSFDVKDMGVGYDYLALGHIHRPQFIHTGNHNVRYSGTPIAVSFDECYEHSISMVEVGKHGDRPKVELIQIVNPRPLVTLPTVGLASWDEAKRLLSEYPSDIPSYIRLNVEVEDFLPVGANADAVALTNGKQCKFCLVNSKRKQSEKSESKSLTVHELQKEDPIGIAIRFAGDIGATTFDEELQRLFKDAVDEVNMDMRNE